MTQMTNGRSLARTVGTLFGAVYVLVGVVGFAVTSGVGFADNDGKALLGIFELNPLHNVVHVAIGAALIWGAKQGVDAARAIDATVGATYLLVGVVGLFVTGSAVNILAINHADNALHLASALVLLVAGLAAAPRAVVADEAVTRTGTSVR